jgi:hypothetical protein
MTSRMYEFRVDGQLPEHALETIGDMRVEEVPPGLILRGEVIDESHLHGIIAQLQGFGLSLVSAQPMAE